jgi:hypothetical protein
VFRVSFAEMIMSAVVDIAVPDVGFVFVFVSVILPMSAIDMRHCRRPLVGRRCLWHRLVPPVSAVIARLGCEHGC